MHVIMALETNNIIFFNSVRAIVRTIRIFYISLALLPSIIVAAPLISRETANQIVVKSDKTTVTANLIYTGQSSQLSVGLGSKPITDFRGGAPKSRLAGCAVTAASVFTTETAAKAAVGACFNKPIYKLDRG
ncbi:hypothetical protein ACTG16_22015 [Aeromonas sp. 23P]|uniref:hypothetical protein n=1 Tax=Aeromonas sp. 23P TaxID=3452716 RepID=UPI003F78FCC4